MQKIKTVIVDDEQDNLKITHHFLKTYCPQIDVVGIADSKNGAIQIINELKPNLVFMDMVLDEGTGFDVLKAIQYKEYKVIFVTAHSEYALKAFKYNAVDYILKPISIEDLIVSVNQAYVDIERALFTNNDQISKVTDSFDKSIPLDFIAIPCMDKIEFIKIIDIVYLKSDGRYTVFVLSSGRKLMASKNLGEYENIIEKTQFFRIHNSYIVNLQHVSKITKAVGSYCIMSNNDSIPVAKRRQDSLSKFLRIK